MGKMLETIDTSIKKHSDTKCRKFDQVHKTKHEYGHSTSEYVDSINMALLCGSSFTAG